LIADGDKNFFGVYRLHRRQDKGFHTVALLLLFAALASCNESAPLSQVAQPPAAAAPDELRDPPVLTAANGVLDLLVIAKPSLIEQFAPYQTTGWVYEICHRPADGADQCPDPPLTDNFYGGVRLQVSGGDVLKIHLVNKLPLIADAAFSRAPGESFLALNPTNLHFHGMLVSPRYATAADPTWGDNVFLYDFNSANGSPATDSNLHGTALTDSVDYRIDIPPGHPSGLYWFHPHVHGISTNQVTSGLSGIVTVGSIADYASSVGPLDVRHLILKDVQVLKEGTLISQGVSSFCGASSDAVAAVNQGGCAGVDQAQFGGHSDFSGGRWFFTINGQPYPTITVGEQAGQIWRILNSSASATYQLNLWDPAQQRNLLMRVISIDGVSIDVKAGTDPSQLVDQAGNRFQPVPCPEDPASGAVCTMSLHLMPSSRAEVMVSYRDANGFPQAPPVGASAVLRTVGYQTGPTGDSWPAIDLASVRFTATAGSIFPLSIRGQTSNQSAAKRVTEALRSANSDVPSDATCGALLPGHKRRIFFGTSLQLAGYWGLGYEEIDENDAPVPGTFRDIAPFDPTTPTVCLPLAPGDEPVTEVWELVNLDSADHNFHIHQSHFSVLSSAEIAGTGLPESVDNHPILMDSVPLVHADGQCGSVTGWRNGACVAHPVTIQIGFDIAGDFVYHCHILLHEDAGMMAVIRVRSATARPAPGPLQRLLAAFHGVTAYPQQPLLPRMGAIMCRGIRHQAAPLAVAAGAGFRTVSERSAPPSAQ
jgi:FtsP/CotA-like multicopper oxidase with cupredoxin domain